MLKTALQPKWLGFLALALVLATVFVVLSAWQFGQSRTEEPPGQGVTEEPMALTEVHEPEQPMTPAEADQIVTLSGEFVDVPEVLIDERVNDGEIGYWAVGAFQVDGAPDDQTIPVVRGWAASPDDVDELRTGESLEVEGRLLPTEAPGEGPRDEPGVFPTLSVAELINIWEVPAYSGFVVAFEMLDDSGGEVGAAAEDSPLDEVWVGPQPEGADFNWLNLFYAVEWVVFGGFAFYLWWRLVKDAHEKSIEEERLDREWEEQWRQQQLAERARERAKED